MDENQLLISYEEMLKAGMHFGRRKTVFNPGMGNFVYMVRDGICIIDLLKTQVELDKSLKILKDIKARGGIILFVALTKQSSASMKELAIEVGMPYVVNRWLGGTLTNFKVLSGRVKRLEEMEKAQKSGELEKYTKKERLEFERELLKMKEKFDGLKKLTRMPDAVFVTSLKESALPIHEAKLMGVKVISVANTDADPNLVDHVIPANDRSKRSIDLLLDIIKRDLSQ